MKSFISRLTTHTTIIIFGSILIRLFVILISPEIADSRNAHRLGDIFLATGSVYKYTQGINPYPPLLIYYYAFIAFLSSNLHLPFVYLVKIVPVLSDVSIMLLLKRYLKNKKAIILYALNPVVIVISSAFGKEDPFIILLVLLAYLNFINKKSVVYTTLFLGISIWLKAFPIFLFLLFFYKIKNVAQKITFSLTCLIPFILIILPFILTDFQSINKTFFSYTGSADYGWLATFKAFMAMTSGNSINFSPINYLLPILLNLSKYLFIFCYLLLIYFLKHSKNSLLLQINLVFLLFFIVYGGIGTNFLFWIIPFLILLNLQLVIVKNFTILSSITTIAYVLGQFYEPVLKYYNLVIFKTSLYVNLFYFITLFIFWIYLIRIFFRLIKKSVF